MIRTLLWLPIRLAAGVVKLAAKLAGFVFSIGAGSIRLVASRLFGVIFGALIGFFLGKGHLRVILFPKKKR